MNKIELLSKLIAKQQAKLDAQQTELDEFKTKTDTEVAGIKARLAAVEVTALPDP